MGQDHIPPLLPPIQSLRFHYLNHLLFLLSDHEVTQSETTALSNMDATLHILAILGLSKDKASHLLHRILATLLVQSKVSFSRIVLFIEGSHFH